MANLVSENFRQTKTRARPKPKRGLWSLLLGLLLFVLIWPVGSVLWHRFMPVNITFLMFERLFEGEGVQQQWRSLDDLDTNLVYAAVASEDGGFCSHYGLDFKAMEKAVKHNERRPGKIRGGSTISQQTAKNVFLWPDRSYVRKGLEAYYTLLMETLWGKRRIMEVYLNVAEWGPGVYGVEAGSQYWFGKSAKTLTPMEAARLIAILPSPRRYQAAEPGPYVRARTNRIIARMGVVRRGGYATCVVE